MHLFFVLTFAVANKKRLQRSLRCRENRLRLNKARKRAFALYSACAIFDMLIHFEPLGRGGYKAGFNSKTKMETRILKVVRQGEAFSVQSSKQESGQIKKCTIVLRELGGSKFENEYVCTMLGNLAGCRFYEGDLVIATLRFSTHEYQGQTFQEILATDIVKLNK